MRTRVKNQVQALAINQGLRLHHPGVAKVAVARKLALRLYWMLQAGGLERGLLSQATSLFAKRLGARR